jgi:hypothetical protein
MSNNHTHLILPNRGNNVTCLNGSYHALKTSLLSKVTCPRCIRIKAGKSTAYQEAINPLAGTAHLV